MAWLGVYSPRTGRATQGKGSPRWTSSQRGREQGRHREGVEQDELVTDFEAAGSALQAVAVEAGREQVRRTLLVGLVDRERRLDREPVGAQQPRQADHM